MDNGKENGNYNLGFRKVPESPCTALSSDVDARGSCHPSDISSLHIQSALLKLVLKDRCEQSLRLLRL